MVRIELPPNEAQILHDLLENRLADLRMEISHTDQQDYRTILRRTKTTLEHVIEQLERREPS